MMDDLEIFERPGNLERSNVRCRTMHDDCGCSVPASTQGLLGSRCQALPSDFGGGGSSIVITIVQLIIIILTLLIIIVDITTTINVSTSIITMHDQRLTSLAHHRELMLIAHY